MATSASPGPATAAPEEKFALTSSRHFPDWLARTGASLAFTTYQAGKVFLIGLKPDGRLAVFERTFARCMGLGISPDARTLLLATHYQLCRFDNVAPPRAAPQGEHDARFLAPRRLDHRRPRHRTTWRFDAGRAAGLRQHAVLAASPR